MISHTVPCHRLVQLSALLLLSPLIASPQTTKRQPAPPATTAASTTAAAQARRDQLAKIPELLADPDPNQRIANLEAILDSNDSTMIQIALRLAFQSDDANLRSLAMRAYIAGTNELTLDVTVPDQISSQYEAAQNDPDKNKIASFRRTYHYMECLERIGFKVHLTFPNYSTKSSSGVVQDPKWKNFGGTFTVSGDRLSANVGIGFSNEVVSCNFEFRPSNDMTLRGTMRCSQSGGNFFPALAISAPIF